MHVNDWPDARKRTASKEKETKKEDENVAAEDGCFLQEQPVGSHPQDEWEVFVDPTPVYSMYSEEESEVACRASVNSDPFIDPVKYYLDYPNPDLDRSNHTGA